MPQSTPKARIALIECWFGPWPAWRELYEKSCANNPVFHFFVLSDQKPPEVIHANITHIPLTLETLLSLVEKHCGRSIQFSRPWEIVKLKPLLGTLFEDKVASFEFWGYHDSDIIWGNAEKFLSASVLDNYDVITASGAWITGHFCIFRRQSPAARPHELIPQYWFFVSRTNNKGVAIDEEILDYYITRLASLGKLRFLKAQWALLDGLHPRWEKRARANYLSNKNVHFEPSFERGECVWDSHSVRHKASGKEFLYFHFQFWKKHYTQNPITAQIGRSYVFNSQRILCTKLNSHFSKTALTWLIDDFVPTRIQDNARRLKARVYRLFEGVAA